MKHCYSIKDHYQLSLTIFQPELAQCGAAKRYALVYKPIHPSEIVVTNQHSYLGGPIGTIIHSHVLKPFDWTPGDC